MILQVHFVLIEVPLPDWDESQFPFRHLMYKDSFVLVTATRLGLWLFVAAWAGEPPLQAVEAPASPPATGTNQVNSRTFAVRRYEISGNSVLRPEIFRNIFTNAIGTNVNLEQIRKALADLQLAYRERGYATVAVSLPQQQLTNATVKVRVTEGKLVAVRVTGNQWFSAGNVLRELPSLHTNALLNSHIFQRELDLANANRDRQIYPTINPGPEPGTSALTLRVKDRLPLHGRLDVDNYSTPGTPELRANLAAQYNNLWQREHQLGISYGFTPQQFKSAGVVPNYLFNQPLIAYYGAYYRLPFGGPVSVEEQINNSLSFGYNEATHQFLVPPAGARPDLTIYASASSSDTGVHFGPRQTVTQTELLSIESQDSGQDVTANESLGGRLSVPVTLNETMRLSFSGGADFKRYSLKSFNTNNFFITTVVTNAQGSQTIESAFASPQPTRRNEVSYVPVAVGFDFSESDKRGSTSANVGGSYNFTGSSADFAQAAYSPQAKSHFGKLNLSFTREQKVYRDWSLLLRANGQAATGPLISNEQFPLGGINSVRGYSDGDEYGDSGWFGSIEARTPYLATRVASIDEFVPTWVRGSIFMDYGQRYLLKPGPGVSQTRSLWGVGFGLSANINNHLEARVAVGFPLLNSANTHAGQPHAYFTIGGQF